MPGTLATRGTQRPIHLVVTIAAIASGHLHTILPLLYGPSTITGSKRSTGSALCSPAP
jgi:hypothetical protein